MSFKFRETANSFWINKAATVAITLKARMTNPVRNVINFKARFIMEVIWIKTSRTIWSRGGASCIDNHFIDKVIKPNNNKICPKCHRSHSYDESMDDWKKEINGTKIEISDLINTVQEKNCLMNKRNRVNKIKKIINQFNACSIYVHSMIWSVLFFIWKEKRS